MSILVQKPGMLTTVQDLGRPRYRRLGINPGGAMDRLAVQLVNALLGNDDNEAVVEIHFPAAHLVFEEEHLIAIGGADLAPHINGERLPCWRPFRVPAGAELTFGGKEVGHRAYLGVSGGFQVQRWLASASTNLAAGVGGFEGRPLRAGDRLQVRGRCQVPVGVKFAAVSPSLIPRYSRFPTVRAIPGAEFELLDESQTRLFASEGFTVTNRSDRMGFRLQGSEIKLHQNAELVSAAVDFGTVQLLPDGQLIVLMAESQTAGGYPRIAHIISVDLPLVGQLGPGDKLQFHMVEQAHAEGLALAAEKQLSFFRVGCRLQAQTWTS